MKDKPINDDYFYGWEGSSAGNKENYSQNEISEIKKRKSMYVLCRLVDVNINADKGLKI